MMPWTRLLRPDTAWALLAHGKGLLRTVAHGGPGSIPLWKGKEKGWDGSWASQRRRSPEPRGCSLSIHHSSKAGARVRDGSRKARKDGMSREKSNPCPGILHRNTQGDEPRLHRSDADSVPSADGAAGSRGWGKTVAWLQDKALSTRARKSPRRGLLTGGGGRLLTPTSTWSEPRSSCLWSSSK